ncbi:MAG TPA: hypothetical protein VN281_21500 [Verrucomicrobiae bacterium]|nr:hypothetical protein [Verrucomicrobiae bacterium]
MISLEALWDNDHDRRPAPDLGFIGGARWRLWRLRAGQRGA